MKKLTMFLVCLISLSADLLSDVCSGLHSEKENKNTVHYGIRGCPFLGQFGSQCGGGSLQISMPNMNGVTKMKCAFGHVWLEKDGELVTPYPRINP